MKYEQTKGTITPERAANLAQCATNVIETLKIKNPKYGDSWRAKGGFSAFFNLDRKWSRVETLAAQYNYDIFAAIDATRGQPDGMLEALKDLMGYDLLILDEKEKLVKYLPYQKMFIAKCDGNHGGPKCQDPECWNGGVPEAEYVDPETHGDLPGNVGGRG